jgi:hypothetical protein
MRLSPAQLLVWGVAVSGALAEEIQQCIVPSHHESVGYDSTVSDSEAIEEVFARCSSDSEITFSEGVEYNVFSPLKATNLSNVLVHHLGNLNLPQNITYVQDVTASAGGSLKWFDIRGKDVSWIGTTDVREKSLALEIPRG